MTLRDYQPEDLEAMYALDVECFAPPFRFSRRAILGFAEAPGAIVVVAEADAGLAGFCIVQIEFGVGYVVTLDVAAASRRRGLGGQLIADAERQVRLAGGAGMALHVFTGNDSAIQFYEAAGYVRYGEAKGFYGRGVDALIYRKDLTAE